MDNQPKKKEKKDRTRLRAAIAIVGFFVILFLGAYLLYRFHARWIIPVTIILAIAWAVFFSMDREKDDEDS